MHCGFKPAHLEEEYDPTRAQEGYYTLRFPPNSNKKICTEQMLQEYIRSRCQSSARHKNVPTWPIQTRMTPVSVTGSLNPYPRPFFPPPQLYPSHQPVAWSTARGGNFAPRFNPYSGYRPYRHQQSSSTAFRSRVAINHPPNPYNPTRANLPRTSAPKQNQYQDLIDSWKPCGNLEDPDGWSEIPGTGVESLEIKCPWKKKCFFFCFVRVWTDRVQKKPLLFPFVVFFVVWLFP